MGITDFNGLNGPFEPPANGRALEPMHPRGGFKGKLDVLRGDRRSVFPCGARIKPKGPPFWGAFPCGGQSRDDVVVFITGYQDG